MPFHPVTRSFLPNKVGTTALYIYYNEKFNKNENIQYELIIISDAVDKLIHTQPPGSHPQHSEPNMNGRVKKI